MLQKLLNAILKMSIRRRWLVVLASLLISVWGLMSSSQMARDVFPPFAPPQVEIQTAAPGLTPEVVEQTISQPIESSVIGLPGVKVVRSASKPALSMIQVQFSASTPLNRARQLVSEQLMQLRGKLPAAAESPQISPLVSPLGTILQYAFTLQDDASQQQRIELRRLVQSIYDNELLAVPGVAQVTIYGGRELQQQVLLNTKAMKDLGISLTDAAEAAANASVISPGGLLIGGGRERLIRPDGLAKSTEDLSRSVIPLPQGRSSSLGQVAKIKRDGAPARGSASFNGRSAVVLMINKQPDVDTPQVTAAVEQRIKELSRSLPSDVTIQRTFRQANFIEMAMANVSQSLLAGVLIVTAVMVLFLMNWRAALITISAIPISLLIALLLMRALGLQVNTMTLGGLVVAIGSVVDDAIVDMENCYRGLRNNVRAHNPVDPLDVVFRTSVEVRKPVLFSTLIIAMVFAPVFTLSGVEGRIFMPMGLAYLLAITASTLVALTLSPALCSILLVGASLPQESSLVETLAIRLYRPWLQLAIRHSQRVLLLALAALIATLLILPGLGRIFLPEFREHSLVNSMVLYPGVSLEMTSRAGSVLAKRLQDSPDVEWVQVRAGRAPGDADGAGVNIAHVDVELSSQALSDRKNALNRLRESFLALPGVAPNVGGFISHRMDEVLSGVRSAIAIKIHGSDLAELRRLGEIVRDQVATVPGVVDLQLEPQLPVQQIQISFDREAALREGVTIAELANSVEIAVQGRKVARMDDPSGEVDVVVKLPEADRGTVDDLRQIPIRNSVGELIALGQLAKVQTVRGQNLINRENASRLIVVSANVAGRPLGPVVHQIRDTLSRAVSLPNGYEIRYGGQFESEERATSTLLVFSLLAAVFIAVLLMFAVRSLPIALAIMINLPLALVGGLVAVVLTGGVLSVASLVGFITLFGVAVRNGLLLVDNFNRRHQLGESLIDLVEAGSMERLNAILMTALTSSLGMLPLALAFGPGTEILQPLAIVVLGGLLTSTALTLLVIPALFTRFGHWLLPSSSSS